MWNKVKYFLLLNLGLIRTAAGISFFKTPNHFAIGGVSGIAIIGSWLVANMDVGTFMFIVNVILIVLGFIFLGKKCGIVTVYASLAMSFYVWMFEIIYPMSAPFTSDTFLELVYAILLPAVGSAILFNIGASTGGTDIVAMILSKRMKMEIGKALFLSDFLITLFAGKIFGIRTGLYCILGLILKAFLVDVVIENINVRKSITIISNEPEQIKDFIIHKLKRGATIYSAKGAYSDNDEQIISVITTRKQAVDLRNFIKKVDPKAFISITNSSEIIGKGFRAI